MRAHLLIYFLRQAITSLRRDRMVHAIGIGTMTVSILIFGFFLLAYANVKTWVHGWGDSLFLSIYIRNDADQAAREQIENLIASFDGAEIVRVVSSDEGLQILKRALGPQGDFLEHLRGDKNPLPVALDVVLKEREAPEINLSDFKKRVEALPGVDEVILSDEWRGRARGMVEALEIAGSVLGGILAVGVLFIVVNTIKLTIYSRREEIEILKLVGATDRFVKAPFLLEGMAHGILSGSAALLILYLSYLALATREIRLMGISVLEIVFIQPRLVVMLFFGSVALGIFGSLIAVNRFFEL